MDAITAYMSAHPAMFAIGVALIIVLFLHFTFKSLFKLVLIVFVILLAIYGYYSYTDQGANTDKTKESSNIVQSVIDDVKAKSKTISKDMKDVYRKSKAAPKEVDKMLDSSNKELDKEFKKK